MVAPPRPAAPAVRASCGELEVFRVASRDHASWEAARLLLAEYFQWLAPVARISSVPDVQPTASLELATPQAVYDTPESALIVARLGRLCVGVVGLVPTSEEGTAELVRFYCTPQARRTGAGRRLLAEAMTCARALGFRSMVLDTAPALMDSAVRLYRSAGFVELGERHHLPIVEAVRLRKSLIDDPL